MIGIRMNINPWMYDMVITSPLDDNSFISLINEKMEDEIQEPYGITLNASYVYGDEATHSLGIRITDSEGMDVDTSVEGDDIYNVVYSALEELYEEITEFNEKNDAEQEAEIAKQAKIQELQADLGNLQQRLDALLNS